MSASNLNLKRDYVTREDGLDISNKPIDIHLQVKNLSSNTLFDVEDLLNYSDEEKEIINSLMELVFKLDDMVEKSLPFYNTIVYNKFIMWYTVEDKRIQNHFKEIYTSFILAAWNAKILNILDNPMPSWKLDIHWIHAQILNILSVDWEFDFCHI